MEDLGLLYIVHADHRKGVQRSEHRILEITDGQTYFTINHESITYLRYLYEEINTDGKTRQLSVDLDPESLSNLFEGLATGYGDLWYNGIYTYVNQEEADAKFIQMTDLVERKYLHPEKYLEQK